MRKHTRTEARCRDAALVWAQEHGYPGESLPAGVRDDAGSCPLALAVGGLIADCVWMPDPMTRAEWKTLPSDVRRFVEMFDAGRFPEMEKRDG